MAETEDGCWRSFHRPRKGDGYVMFKVDGASILAHRFAYEVFVGEIEPGMELDHLCNNRDCMNPEHLEQVTREENVKRAASRRTTCRRGHPHSEYAFTNSNGHRSCRKCTKEYQAEYYRNNPEKWTR